MKRYYTLMTIIAVLFIGSRAQTTDLYASTLEPEIIPRELRQSDHLRDMVNMQLDYLPVLYDSAGLDSFIRARMESEHIPGVATWASKNGQVIWQQCFGYANLADSIAVADTTSFMLASISKTITGTAIMQLWERGEFGLDDDINNYLPFTVRSPYHPDSAITFRMLMTHTSSINDNWGILSPLWQPGDPTMPLSQFVYEYLVPGGIYYSTANFNDSVPGVYYEYCNTAIALLAYLVEEMEDSFPIHCQDSIFEPLNMIHTSWFLAGLDTNNIALRYAWSGSYYVPLPHIGHPFYPCAQLRASLVDLAQHLTAIMQYGITDTVRILDSATVEVILSHHFTVDPNLFMGLTWRYSKFYNRWIWYHPGSMTGVSTIYGFCPAESSAIIVLTNSQTFYTGTEAIARALFDYAEQYGIAEEQITRPVKKPELKATIFSGPLLLPEGKKCRVFDITGRVVFPDKMRPGIYFIEVDGEITQKVVKVR